jgi:endo-1,4-beta-xylanase
MKTQLTQFIATTLVSGVLAGASAQPALKDVFKDKFLIGAALNESQSNEQNAPQVALIQRQFNTVTPENVMKWERIHPEADRFNFAPADRYVEFGQKHKMFIVGHTLIWHSQTPSWVFEDAQGNPLNRDALLNRMREHIEAVMGRYKGKIGGWDVVNEALNENGTLRNSPWRKIIGDDYIAKAFEFAHAVDPQAELYYNDFSVEKEAKRRGVVELIKRLQQQGVKVFGVGMQGHYRLNTPTTTQVDETIAAFSKLGVKVMITELDVDVLPLGGRSQDAEVSLNFAPRPEINPYTNGLPDSVQQQLAQRYADLFSVFEKHRGAISRVTFWGVTDGNSWLNDWPVRGRTSYPLLFDREGRPKPAFKAVTEPQNPGLGKVSQSEQPS